MATVFRKFTSGIPTGAILVDRSTKWGNPFRIGVDGTREQVIAKYETYLTTSDLMNDIAELRDKDLVCWCAPEPCHGDVLLRLANG